MLLATILFLYGSPKHLSTQVERELYYQRLPQKIHTNQPINEKHISNQLHIRLPDTLRDQVSNLRISSVLAAQYRFEHMGKKGGVKNTFPPPPVPSSWHPFTPHQNTQALLFLRSNQHWECGSIQLGVHSIRGDLGNN